MIAHSNHLNSTRHIKLEGLCQPMLIEPIVSNFVMLGDQPSASMDLASSRDLAGGVEELPNVSNF
jgi:hypothetical protein